MDFLPRFAYSAKINDNGICLRKDIESAFSMILKKNEIEELKSAKLSFDLMLSIIQKLYLSFINTNSIKMRVLNFMLPEPIFITMIDKKITHCFSIIMIRKFLSLEPTIEIKRIIKQPSNLVNTNDYVQDLDSKKLQRILHHNLVYSNQNVIPEKVIPYLIKCYIIAKHAAYHYKYFETTNFTKLDYSHQYIFNNDYTDLSNLLTSTPNEKIKEYVKFADFENSIQLNKS